MSRITTLRPPTRAVRRGIRAADRRRLTNATHDGPVELTGLFALCHRYQLYAVSDFRLQTSDPMHPACHLGASLMIIVTKAGITDAELDHLRERVEALGLRTHISRREQRTIIGCICD